MTNDFGFLGMFAINCNYLSSSMNSHQRNEGAGENSVRTKALIT